MELTTKFQGDPEVLRSMLTLLIRKGRVRSIANDKKSKCGSKCFKCNPLSTEIYEWIDF